MPKYGGFRLDDIINSSNLSPSKKLIAVSVTAEMETILKSEGCIEASREGNLLLQLNAHGRKVQQTGGISAYASQQQRAGSPKLTKIFSRHLITIIIGVLITVIGGYILYRLHWLG